MPRQRPVPTETKSAPLTGDFGLSYARRLFGDEAVESLPLYKAGPNKGKPKGHVTWLRTLASGYHPNAGGGVGEGVTVRAWISAYPHAPEGAAMSGTWMGRTQTLCGSACMLGPQARERDRAERARDEEEREAMYAQVTDTDEAEAAPVPGGPR
jgi:hypothetical protein